MPIKTIYKLFSIEEDLTVITEAYLGATGLSIESEMIVVRRHQGDYNSEQEAIEDIKTYNINPEHGFEVIKTYIHIT